MNKSTIFIIPFHSLLYCRAEGNYTCFALKDKKILIYQTLKKTLSLLPPDTFCRCHNSIIVNLNEILEISLKINYLILKDKTVLPISTRRKKVLRSAIRKVT